LSAPTKTIPEIEDIQIEEEVVVVKKTKKKYFDQDTEDSIVKFQKEPDIEIKKIIFVKEIRPAFLKLIENVIFVYKFYTLGDVDGLKNDCMSFLFEVLHKFDPSRGCKAFSYFDIVAKNWFIQKIKNVKKRNKIDVHFDQTIADKLEREEGEKNHKQLEALLIESQFFVMLRDEIKKWRFKFDKKQEKLVLESIILILENPDLISLHSKKAVYLYLREISGLSTKQIVTNIQKFKKKYDGFKKRYYDRRTVKYE
jgi:hypothetical protein